MTEERFELAKERILGIAQQSDAEEVTILQRLPEPFLNYFDQMAQFLQLVLEAEETVRSGRIREMDLAALQALNHHLYEDILPAHYAESYGNPAFSCHKLGKEYGQLLSFLYTELRSMIPFAFEGQIEELTIRMELFLQVYQTFLSAVYDTHAEEVNEATVQAASLQEDGCLPSYAAVYDDIYYFVSDYTRESFRKKLSGMFEPEQDFAWKLIREANIENPSYLYLFGEYITENELRTYEHLKELPQETIDLMAHTYTEGYRIGFAATNKDISRKKIVNIRYTLGFERMILQAIANFEQIGLKPVIYRAPASLLMGRSLYRNGFTGAVPNKQYDFDHKDDIGLFLDKRLVQIRLEAWKECFEEQKEKAALFGGPAVVEVFGEAPQDLQEKEEAVHLSKEQQKLSVSYAAEAGEIQNHYIREEERSFTIIAFPTPDIGEDYPEIFDEIIRINTLDYMKYRDIQQKLIDALDLGQYVLVKGKGDNRTDMKVMLHHLSDAAHQTNFENCVADVNIPVGEVFTSPVLTGTEGTLHVSHVFLNGLAFKDLMLTFRDGKVSDYRCANFADEGQNRKYIEDNILFHHETLPIGEFAIGTNTTAYAAARRFHMEDKLPILIAEKTGPHFAVGDTCYSHAEDVVVYNPDGKEIIARENECAALRKTNPAEAYFNCHTDITIPFDELKAITVVREDGETIPLIADGKFVLCGCEELNEPLHGMSESRTESVRCME